MSLQNKVKSSLEQLAREEGRRPDSVWLAIYAAIFAKGIQTLPKT